MKIIIYIISGIIIGLVLYLFSFEKDFINFFYNDKIFSNSLIGEDDDDDEINRLVEYNNIIAVKLSPDEIKSSGITVSKLEKGSIVVNEKVNAISIGTKSLFDLYKRFEILNIDQTEKIINKEFIEKKYLRLKSLYEQQGSVAFKEIEEEKFALKLVENELLLLKKNMELLLNEIKLFYGEIIVNDILGTKEIINALISNTSSLLIVENINSGIDNIYKFNDEELIFLNTYSGISNLRGNVGIYLAKSLKISANSKLIVSLETDKMLDGYYLPEQSLVYYAGKIWVYATENNEIFVRKEIRDFMTLDTDRVFILGDMLNLNFVNSGAQVLLAEEFRWQIMQEDDD